MCGIYAVERPEYAAGVLKAMRYRGPDEQQIFGSKSFCVGVNRLAIVDTVSIFAMQPWTTRKGRIIAFNGEIYNYRQLDPSARSEVSLLGEMIDRRLDPRQFCDGDYAILYYSPSEEKITLYRDRFGVCPLYYQLRPFVSVCSERRRLQNPREVPAFGKVVIDLSMRKVRSVDVMKHYGATCVNWTALIDTLLHAVHSRAMHSDVGFSLALSGGLDSSTIAYALNAMSLRPSAMITVALNEDSDDLRYSREVAADLGWPLQEIIVSPEELFADKADIFTHLDSPHKPITALKWRGAVRNWFAAKYCSTKVMLSGEGADELLSGYPSHWRNSSIPYLVAAKSLSTIRSMPSINLDRTNKLGMAHSVEYRVPYLESSLSYALLSEPRVQGKPALQTLLHLALGAKMKIANRPKYGNDEPLLEESMS